MRVKRKNRVWWLVVGMVFGGIGVIWSQQGSTSPKQVNEITKENDENVELIWKKDFSEEIKDVIIKSERIKKKVLKDKKEIEIEEEMFYPKAIITGKGIKFIGDKNEVKNTVGKSGGKKSKNGEFVFSGEVIKFTSDGKWPDKKNLSVFTSDGQLLWEKEHSTHELAESIDLSPDGKYVIIINTLDYIRFSILSSSGEKKLDIGQENLYPVDVMFPSFSDNGDFFMVTVKYGNKTDHKTQIYIYIFDRNGNVILKKSAKEFDCTAITGKIFSLDNTLVVLTGSKVVNESDEYKLWTVGGVLKKNYILLIDIKGNLLWKKEMSTRYETDQFIFSDKNDLLIAMEELDNQVYMFNIKDGNLVWQYDGKLLGGTHLAKLDATSDLEYILITTQIRSKYEFSGNFEGVYLLNKKGEKILEKHFKPYEVLNTFGREPQVFISPLGKNIIVNTGNGLQKIEISFKEVK